MPDWSQIDRIIDSAGWLPYVIILVWTFFEGETIVLIAGFAAHDRTPWLPFVILSAFCGSLLGDQLWFFLGRHKGKAFIAKHPRWQARAEKVYRLLERHQNWLIFGFRFLYGLRNVTPLAIGMSEVKASRFLILNVTGAAVWATTFAYVGYLFGAAMKDVLKYQKWAMVAALVLVVAVFWIVRLTCARRKRKRELAAEAAKQTPEAHPAIVPAPQDQPPAKTADR